MLARNELLSDMLKYAHYPSSILYADNFYSFSNIKEKHRISERISFGKTAIGGCDKLERTNLWTLKINFLTIIN